MTHVSYSNLGMGKLEILQSDNKTRLVREYSDNIDKKLAYENGNAKLREALENNNEKVADLEKQSSNHITNAHFSNAMTLMCSIAWPAVATMTPVLGAVMGLALVTIATFGITSSIVSLVKSIKRSKEAKKQKVVSRKIENKIEKQERKLKTLEKDKAKTKYASFGKTTEATKVDNRQVYNEINYPNSRIFDYEVEQQAPARVMTRSYRSRQRSRRAA